MDKVHQQELFQEIKEKNDIVDIISEYVTLRRSGRSFQGLCPFHSEKTPSFNVNQAKQFFYCFGCGVGGDIFSFIMKIESLEFIEAAQRLANRVGVKWPENTPVSEMDRKKEELYKINQLVAAFFQQFLLKTDVGERGRQYLENRGISDIISERFMLGYAPAAWNTLTEVLRKKGIPLEVAEQLGVVSFGDKGFYDQFRDRVIFPIIDPKGRVIGFGGRIIDNNGGPKYLNSPETPLFHKGHSLYGLFQAKEAIKKKKQAIIVEGYLDAIQAHQAGFTHAIASLGTALTKEQAKVVSRYSSEVILAYDADNAGQHATERGMEILQQNGLMVRIPILPQGEDPDSFIRNQGREKFELAIEEAVSLVDFKIAQTVRQFNVNTPDGKAQAIRSILPYIAAIEDNISREAYIRRLVREVGASETAIWAELREWLKNRKVLPALDNVDKYRDNKGETEKIELYVDLESNQMLSPIQRAIFDVEKELLKTVLQEYDKLARIKEKLSIEDFTYEPWRGLFAQIIIAEETNKSDIKIIIHELSGTFRETAVTLIAEQEMKERSSDYEGTLNKLRMLKLKNQIQALTDQINMNRDENGKPLNDAELKSRIIQFTELKRKLQKEYPHFSAGI